MTLLLVVLTVAEVLLLVTVLAVYLIAINRRLVGINKILGRVAFGVRAVESQTAAIKPSVTELNATLNDIDEALGPLMEKAAAAAKTSRGRRPRFIARSKKSTDSPSDTAK